MTWKHRLFAVASSVARITSLCLSPTKQHFFYHTASTGLAKKVKSLWNSITESIPYSYLAVILTPFHINWAASFSKECFWWKRGDTLSRSILWCLSSTSDTKWKPALTTSLRLLLRIKYLLAQHHYKARLSHSLWFMIFPIALNCRSLKHHSLPRFILKRYGKSSDTTLFFVSVILSIYLDAELIHMLALLLHQLHQIEVYWFIYIPKLWMC